MFSLLTYSYSLWTTHVYLSPVDKQLYCVPSLLYTRFLTIAGYVDLIITLLLPFFIIGFINIRIVVAMMSQFRGDCSDNNSSFHTRMTTDRATTGLIRSPEPLHNRSKVQTRITKMLIIVSTSFLILNLPSHAIRVYMFVMRIRGIDHKVSRATIMWQQIAQVSIIRKQSGY